MKRIMAWLRGGVQGKKPSSVLPQSLLDLLSGGTARHCKEALEGWVASGIPSAEAVDNLAARANASGWSEDEIEKIYIYLDFYSGHNEAAYNRIVARGFEGVDFDLFMVACFSLYVLDKYEEAYTLLKTRHSDELRLSATPMFLGFAGFIVFSSGRSVQEAMHYLDMGLPGGLDAPSFLTNGYTIYFEAGDLEKCALIRKTLYEKKIADPQVVFAVACVELARDYYPEGFRLAESRYDHPDVARHMNVDLLGKPRWRGEELQGKRLLVHGEQGLGDTVMCARYIPLLIEAGIKVVLDCQDAAVSLIEHNYPEIQVVNRDTPAALDVPFDYWVGAMSLPHLLNSTAVTVPGKGGYMTVAGEHKSHWRNRISSTLSGSGLRVGVAWSGNPRHRSDRRRSIGLDAMFSYIESCKDIQFFALQTNVPNFLPENLIEFSDEMMTLSDTAALIMEMDVVLTVDTSIVHVAGALGKPTWLMLPYRYEWRWGLVGEENAWYESVRVIRQERHGDWEPVLARVFETLLPQFIVNYERSLQ